MVQVSLKRPHLLKGIQLMKGILYKYQRRTFQKKTTENAKVFSKAGDTWDDF